MTRLGYSGKLAETFKVAACYSESEYMTDGRREYDEQAHRDADHLEELADGCGCAEVWEHLSEQRASD